MPTGVVWTSGGSQLELISSGAGMTWADSAFSWSSAVVPWNLAYHGEFRLTQAETLNLEEIAFRKIGFRHYESLNIKESLSRSIRMAIAESLAISEEYVDHIAFMLRIFESLGLEEGLRRNGVKSVAESVGITSEESKRFWKNVSEAAGFVETFGRTVHFKKKINEGFAVVEAMSKSMQVSKHEAFGLFDEYVRRANGVISDMLLSSGDLTFADFKNVVDAGKAPGFAPFRDFIPGDYTYQHAIFRTVLESTNSDRARLDSLKLIVDVPDVFDRGTVIIPEGAKLTGVRVNFNRVFHVVPEITLTLKGGTVIALPNSLAPDLTGFTALLTDPSTGIGVAGSVAWAAHGY